MKSTSTPIEAVLGCLLLALISLPASAANIAWITLNPADNMPSFSAATAGFTPAPDVGYTQVLSSAGHNVTRFVTHDNPTPADLATLNTFDLVIVGRSVGSGGHYQAANETLFWNTTLTKPLIHMGGLPLRGPGPTNTFLGFYVDDTIAETTSPIRLTVSDPGHPIFAGIALDGTNTMVDAYANLAVAPFAPNTEQRGILTIIDPLVAGGQVLATATLLHPATLDSVPGTIIAYLPPGTLTSTTPANQLGGHRLVFLSGSRENSGLTTEGAGIFDLTADGSRMFLNAVNFMVAIPEPADITGDYNQNGAVDAADYVAWRKTLNQPGAGLAADGNEDGNIDAEDYNIWRRRFANTALSATAQAVAPEPATAAMLLVAALTVLTYRPVR